VTKRILEHGGRPLVIPILAMLSLIPTGSLFLVEFMSASHLWTKETHGGLIWKTRSPGHVKEASQWTLMPLHVLEKEVLIWSLTPRQGQDKVAGI
jgi:hypothetical protein